MLEKSHKNSLPVVAIFLSIDGEVNCFGQGTPSVFIRLAGCNLRCWGGKCDTPQGLEVTKDTRYLSVDAIVKEVEKIGCKKVTITGGEPLLYILQLEKLVKRLKALKMHISVETIGSIPLPCVNSPTSLFLVDCWVYDYKCPSTLETAKMVDLSVLYAGLRRSDYIKFVIADEEDYLFAQSKVSQYEDIYRLSFSPIFAFSPKLPEMDPAWLVERMLADRLFYVRFNLQIHKYIWPNAKKEV
jgi:7-carboxy-7-deazaguanine synthase